MFSHESTLYINVLRDNSSICWGGGVVQLAWKFAISGGFFVKCNSCSIICQRATIRGTLNSPGDSIQMGREC